MIRHRNLMLIIFVVLSVATAYQVYSLKQDFDQANADRSVLAQSQAQTAEQAEALASQVRSLGERPVVTSKEIDAPVEVVPGPPGAAGIQGPPGEPGGPGEPGQDGQDGDPGPAGADGADGSDGSNGSDGEQGPGPSPEQTQRAVNAFCADDRCDGQSATPGQVAAAVATYCNVRGECRGAAGGDGESGADGTDGTDGVDGADGADGERGPAGPAPTAEQINEAVRVYCSGQESRCQGPEGPAGPAGPEGPAATDDQGLTCVSNEDGSITVFITGGTPVTIRPDSRLPGESLSCE